MSLLVVRADAARDIGTGHFMRSLALAEAWGALGAPVVFVSCCTSSALRTYAEVKGVAVVALEAEPGSPDDLKQTLAVLRSADQAALCIDGYSFCPEYQRGVRDGGYVLLLIDDTAHQPEYYADLLHNQNIGSERLTYCVNADAELLLGPRFALLRSEFLAPAHAVKSVARDMCRVLVTFGGSDPANLTPGVVRSLAESTIADLHVTVLVGAANANAAQVRREVAIAGTRFRTVHEIGNMPELIRGADLAVSAAGSTCWELCHLGVPAVVLATADNQRGVAEGLDDSGAALNLGWHADVTAAQIRSAVEALVGASDRRAEMSAAGRALVDGHGAERVAHALARRVSFARGASA